MTTPCRCHSPASEPGYPEFGGGGDAVGGAIAAAGSATKDIGATVEGGVTQQARPDIQMSRLQRDAIKYITAVKRLYREMSERAKELKDREAWLKKNPAKFETPHYKARVAILKGKGPGSIYEVGHKRAVGDYMHGGNIDHYLRLARQTVATALMLEAYSDALKKEGMYLVKVPEAANPQNVSLLWGVMPKTVGPDGKPVADPYAEPAKKGILPANIRSSAIASLMGDQELLGDDYPMPMWVLGIPGEAVAQMALPVGPSIAAVRALMDGDITGDDVVDHVTGGAGTIAGDDGVSTMPGDGEGYGYDEGYEAEGYTLDAAPGFAPSEVLDDGGYDVHPGPPLSWADFDDIDPAEVMDAPLDAFPGDSPFEQMISWAQMRNAVLPAYIEQGGYQHRCLPSASYPEFGAAKPAAKADPNKVGLTLLNILTLGAAAPATMIKGLNDATKAKKAGKSKPLDGKARPSDKLVVTEKQKAIDAIKSGKTSEDGKKPNWEKVLALGASAAAIIGVGVRVFGKG